MTMLDRPIDQFEEPGKLASGVLTVVMHLLLFTALFFGIRWQNRQPEAVSVELWTAPPAPVAAPPRLPEPRPEPKVEPKVEPRPAPRPEPAVEKPDIAIERAKQEQERKRREDDAARLKREQEQKAKDEAARQQKLAEAEAQRRLAAQLAESERKRIQEQLAQASPGASAAKAGPVPTVASAGDPRARAEWGDRIKAKIKPNIIYPLEDIPGNPEAILDVQILPTGEVMTVRLRKSSGVRGYDEAIERAIKKASPLPRPENPAVFERDLELKFRPRD